VGVARSSGTIGESRGNGAPQEGRGGAARRRTQTWSWLRIVMIATEMARRTTSARTKRGLRKTSPKTSPKTARTNSKMCVPLTMSARTK
jgi:hypothetical protein